MKLIRFVNEILMSVFNLFVEWRVEVSVSWHVVIIMEPLKLALFFFIPFFFQPCVYFSGISKFCVVHFFVFILIEVDAVSYSLFIAIKSVLFVRKVQFIECNYFLKQFMRCFIEEL